MGLIPWVWDWTASTWTAIGQIGTLVVAVVAASFVRRQVLEARRTREDRAQPFVVVDFEPSPAGRIFIDLVIRNTGLTLARNVQMSFDPPLRSTLSDADDKRFMNASSLMSNGIPTLPPGRVYRMLFERMPDLKDNEDLPRAYIATVNFEDPRGRPHVLESLLDLDIYFGARQIRSKGVHEAVDALAELQETIARWAQQGVDVRVESIDDSEEQRLASGALASGAAARPCPRRGATRRRHRRRASAFRVMNEAHRTRAEGSANRGDIPRPIILDRRLDRARDPPEAT